MMPMPGIIFIILDMPGIMLCICSAHQVQRESAKTEHGCSPACNAEAGVAHCARSQASFPITPSPASLT